MDIKKLSPMIMEITGGLILIIPLIIGAIRGFDIADLLFERVVTSLQITLFLRKIYFTIFLLGIFMIIIAITVLYLSRTRKQLTDRQIYTRLILYFLSGYVMVTWLLHWLLDTIFYRGAFVSLSYLIGVGLLVLLCLQFSLDQTNLKTNNTTTDKWRRIAILIRYLVLGLLAMIIIIPTLLPVAGILPTAENTPPDYGGEMGLFEVNKIKISNQIAGNITPYLLSDNENNLWYSFVYYPLNSNLRNIPVVLFAHGFGGSDPVEYENTLFQLASRGAVVIFTQYVTNVDLDNDFVDTPNTNFTSSNAMYFRYFMTWNGMKQAVEAIQVENVLSGSMNLSYLLIIGHSVGGGMIPYLATKAVKNGWGDEMLILDMETPWFAGTHHLTTYNLTVLPSHTIVNIAGSEDDHLASPCIGMKFYEKFRLELVEANLAYIINPSDRYGFPRLVATHYLITARINDHLTLWGYMKRIDAMVVMLYEFANNNPISTSSYFLGGGNNMIEQGQWSDGKAINPLIYTQDPFGLRGSNNLAEKYISAHDMGPLVCSV